MQTAAGRGTLSGGFLLSFNCRFAMERANAVRSYKWGYFAEIFPLSDFVIRPAARAFFRV